jgi:flavodoxin
MKVLVAYLSLTGNTKKVAESIYTGISCEKEIKELKDVQGLDNYDLTFLGFPIHAFGPAKHARNFIDKYLAGKKIALFTTHSAPENSEDIKDCLRRCREAASAADILDFFNCRGKLAEDLIETFKKNKDPRVSSLGETGPQTKGLPDAVCLKKAEEFAREIIGKLSG